MAVVGPLGLVRLVREVSVNDIRKQADRVPRVVLCGTPEQRGHLRDLLLAGSTDEMDRARLAQAISEIDLPLEGDEVVRSLTAQVLFTTTKPDTTLLRLKVPVFQVTDEQSLRAAGDRLAALEDEWLVGLARHVPGLRSAMAERLTASTSIANAEIALLSALPSVLPITQFLLPTAAMADIVLLTKNQLMLVLKLAAGYGRPVQLTSRLGELAPVVGSAFGWRALAREVVGMVPSGVGVVAKASVAYAGTYTVGKAAQYFYTHGVRLSALEEKKVFAEAMERARDVVSSLLRRLRGQPQVAPEAKTEAEESQTDAPGG